MEMRGWLDTSMTKMNRLAYRIVNIEHVWVRGAPEKQAASEY